VKAWFVGACINDNELILPCRFSNDIVVFDLATLEVNICSIADEQTFFSWCCYANGYYWVAGCSGDIYKWSKADSVWYKVYSACSAVHSAWTTGFEYNGYVWVFGQYFDEVLRINPKTDDVEVVYELLSNYKYDKTISNPFFRINWLFAEPFDSGIVAFRLKSRELVIFDPETEKVESHGIKLSSIENEKIKNELYKVSILSNPIIEVSGGLFNLSDFLKYLSLNIKSDSENIAQESDGKLIFEYVKEIMLSG
jgi:hypothetical protein